MNPKKISILLSSVLILSSCSSQKINSQSIGNGIGTSLILGGIASFPSKEDKDNNKNSYDSDRKKSYGLIAGGIATYYLMSFLRKAKEKRDKEKARQERWNNNKCDSRAEKIKINKPILANHKIASSKYTQALASCPRVVTGKPKPLNACSDKEKSSYGIAVCSTAYGGCKTAFDKKFFIGAVRKQLCEQKVLDLKNSTHKFASLENAAANANVYFYSKKGDELLKSDKFSTRAWGVGMKMFSNWSEKEKFNNCTYEVESRCEKEYKKWEKNNTSENNVCISKVMGNLQSKLLEPNKAYLMKKEEKDFKKLCN